LRPFFRTDRHVLMVTCTATAFMEVAARSGVRNRVLSLVGGAYGERFASICESVGNQVVRLNVPLGKTVEADMVDDALRRSPVDAVTLVHSETSTGALAPLQELAEVVREHDDVLLLVDAVTSLGASPIETDDWEIDFVFSSSYGALGLPPGLVVAVASERLCDRAISLPDRGASLDLISMQESANEFQPTFTPAIPLIFGLDKQLKRIEETGGVEARWRRHESMLELVEAWAEQQSVGTGFKFLTDRGRRSHTVSCLEVPVGENGRALAKTLLEGGHSIGSGYGRLKRETIRIGHMGDHTVDELRNLLSALGELVAGAQPE